ncbi:MAG: mannosyltransferase family protein [Propionicimonas sp.]|nr:mannosyltransferase family protein [Propionicimonas sp.]
MSVRLVIQTWLGTRLLLAVVAAWVMLTTGRTFTQVVGNWDAQHYLTIAAEGYTDPTKYAFFPGWPLLLRLVGLTGLPEVVAGVLLALACSAAAAAALYRLGGPGAAIAWLLAPVAVFTAVPYTEALFCAAAFWAWERASARHWGQAALLAAVAAGVRVSGVFLIGALAILALSQPVVAPSRPGVRARRLAWLALPVAVIGGYVGYLYLQTGSWWAWYQAQVQGWGRQFSWPWEALQHTIEATAPGTFPATPAAEWVFKAEIVSMAAGLLVTVVCLVRQRWAEAGWVGVQLVAFSTGYWFMSVNRAVLLWFPLWTLLGELAKPRGRGDIPRRVVIGLAVLLALVMQVRWAFTFFTGDWSS